MSRYEYLPGAILRIVASAWIKKQAFTLDGKVPSVYFRVPDIDDVPPFILINTFTDSPYDAYLREEQASFMCVVSEHDGLHGAIALRTLVADMVTKESSLIDINRYIELAEQATGTSIPYRFKEIEIVGSSEEPDWDTQGKLVNATIIIRYSYTFQKEVLPNLSDSDFVTFI